jgi:twinkle protein
MAQLIEPDVDLSPYLEVMPGVKIKRAQSFVPEVVAYFSEREPGNRSEMFSTKLRSCIEFRPGEVTAWAGYNGHRKSMFTGQVALDLCVQRERVLMVSLEMLPHITLARMARQASGSINPPRGLIEAFGRWTDGRLWLFNHVGTVKPHTMLGVCRYFKQEMLGTQVFIDSMMMVCESEESLDEQKQLVTDLVRVAQETEMHIHLVTHCRKPQDDSKPPTKYDMRGTAAISDQAHNVVTIWANKPKMAALQKDPHDEGAKAQPDARVAVEKQRNGEFEGSVALWWHKPSMRFMDDRVSLVQPYDFLNPDRRAA